MQRRDFLNTLLLTGLGSLFFKSAFSASRPINLNYVNDHAKLLALLESTKKTDKFISITGIDPTIDFMYSRENGDVGAVRPGIVFFNDNNESAIIDVPIFPHSIEQNPDISSRVMLIPRRGQSCVEFDVIQNKVVTEIVLKEKKFYGHGCYVPGTTLFYASTYLYGATDASMVLIDSKTKQVIKEIEIEGAAGAHQCIASRDGKYIIMTFSRETKNHKASIVWLEIATGKVSERIYGMEEHAEHLQELSDGFIVYTGGDIPTSTNPGLAVFGSVNPEKKVLNFNAFDKDLKKKITGQGVGIVGLVGNHYSVFTDLIEGMVYFFDYKTGDFIKKIAIRNPRGINISNDEKSIWVTNFATPSGRGGGIIKIDIKTLEITNKYSVTNAKAYSSHTSKFYFK